MEHKLGRTDEGVLTNHKDTAGNTHVSCCGPGVSSQHPQTGSLCCTDTP